VEGRESPDECGSRARFAGRRCEFQRVPSARAQAIAPSLPAAALSIIQPEIETEYFPSARRIRWGDRLFAHGNRAADSAMNRAERIENMPADDFRKRTQNFQEPVTRKLNSGRGSAGIGQRTMGARRRVASAWTMRPSRS